MKRLLLILLPLCCHGFSSRFVAVGKRWPTVATVDTHQQLFAQKVELEPEPEGGIELTPRTSIAGCRMKQLEEMKSIKSDSPVFKFWLAGEVQGALIVEIRTQILKDASKKANFPGFKKGQVPPYAQPQITQFSVQESIIKTVQAAVESYGLKSLPGSDGEFKVHEDVIEISKGYKNGDSIKFTATVNAAYDPQFITQEKIVSVPMDKSEPSTIDTIISGTDEDLESSVDEDATTTKTDMSPIPVTVGTVVDVESSG